MSNLKNCFNDFIRILVFIYIKGGNYNMGKYQELLEYLTKNHILDKHNINEKNISFWVSNEFKNNEFINSYTKSERIKKVFYIIRKNKCLQLINILSKSGIPYILFKGIVLAERLYELPYYRPIGDIDLFVSQEYYYQVVNILQNNQYDMIERTKDTNHHVVFNDNDVSIELHKNILNPFTNIDETYIRNHTETISIEGNKITTFDVTATLLHLIYHLYMDTYLASNNIYFFANKEQFGIAKRFLYRAYEIALFSEKYFKEIKWNDIISDIKTQKLRIIFKYMVDDILEIFPNAFPQALKKAIYNKSYIENEDDMLFYKFLEGHKNHKQEKRYLLCEFIEKFWQRGNNNALLNLDGSAIVLEDKDFNEFKCICNISRNDKKIHIEFTIEDDDIFFSDLGNYDTQKSDGIHLILCSTTEYSYNSIFFFPKNTKENNKVIPYDFLEGKVVENDIIASYEMIKNGYKMNVTLTEEFITKNHLDSFFYLGLVVSSCSSKTKHREKQLVLSSPADQWYNPLHFAKINI